MKLQHLHESQNLKRIKRFTYDIINAINEAVLILRQHFNKDVCLKYIEAIDYFIDYMESGTRYPDNDAMQQFVERMFSNREKDAEIMERLRLLHDSAMCGGIRNRTIEILEDMKNQLYIMMRSSPSSL